jgi:hypothetical protein
VSKPTEAEFLAQYEPQPYVQRLALQLYRERYPSGVHHQGPMRVDVDARLLEYLLTRWRREP